MRSPGTEALRELVAAEIDALPAPPGELFLRTLAVYRAEVRWQAAGAPEGPISFVKRIVLAVTFAFLPSMTAGQVAAGLGLSKPPALRDLMPGPRSLAKVGRLFGLA